MKTYLYYATEENCFEMDKFSTENPIGDVKQFMQDDYLQTDEIEAAAYQMQADFEKDGFAVYETTQGQGYDIVIGIARYGKCHEVTEVIKDRRREAIALCY
jgi:hypothetical protein